MSLFSFPPVPGGGRGGVPSPPVYIPPSGDTSGATDVAAINVALAGGGSVQLIEAPLNAPYYVNAPIVMSSQSRLWGAQWWAGSQSDSYGAGSGGSGGTVIVATPGFTGPGVISMVNTTSTQYYGVDLAGFTLECYEVSTPGVHGIVCEGAWGAGFIRGVTVHRPPGDCFHFEAGASPYVPDEWIFDSCKASASRNGNGFFVVQLPDAVFINCNGSENSLDGWVFSYNTNSKVVACKGENNGQAGFHCAGFSAGEYMQFAGCNTNFNGQDGWLFDNSGSGGLGTYLLSGCRASNDGQAGGTTYAGFRASGCLSRIIGDGCVALGAAYGAAEGGSSYGMCFTGSYLSGTTAGTHDDGTNTHVLVNQSPVPF